MRPTEKLMCSICGMIEEQGPGFEVETLQLVDDNDAPFRRLILLTCECCESNIEGIRRAIGGLTEYAVTLLAKDMRGSIADDDDRTPAERVIERIQEARVN